MSDAQPAPHSAGLRGGCAPCPEPFLLYLAPAYQPREAQPPRGVPVAIQSCLPCVMPVPCVPALRQRRCLPTYIALTLAHITATPSPHLSAGLPRAPCTLPAPHPRWPCPPRPVPNLSRLPRLAAA